MRTWFSRVLVVVFFFSMVAAPYLQVSAQDVAGLPQATPIASETPIVDGPDDQSAPVGNDTEDVGEDVTAPAEGMDEPGKIDAPVGTPETSETSSSARGIKPLALDDDTTYFWNPWFYDTYLEIEGEVSAGGVVDPGETLTFTYSNEFLILDETEVSVNFYGPISAVGTAKADQSTGTITLTFVDGFEVGDSWVEFWFEIPGTVGIFPECRDLPGDHNNYVELVYGLPFGQTSYQTVENDEECEGTGLPNVEWMNFDPFSQQFGVDLYVESMPPAGHEITITYPADQVTISPNPTNFYLYNYTTGEDVLVATGSANNGVITITFLGVEINEEDEWASWVDGYFHATLNDAVCDTSAGLYYQDLEEIVLTASTGLVERVWLDGRLCNAASPVKSGAWNEDGTRIIWTIDTGDLLNGASIQDIGGPGDYSFDCSTLTVAPTNPDVYFDQYCDGENGNGFSVDLWGAEIVRATITIEAVPVSEPMYTSYLNCAFIAAYGGNEQDRAPAATDGTGYGESLCAEVFPEDGGDYITKTVSSGVVDSGELLTYTITASTSSMFWFSVDVVDELPAGFVVTNTSCAMTPVEFQAAPCSVLSEGNVLTASAVNGWSGTEEPVVAGVEIVLTIEGYFDVAQDSVIVNEACSERMIELFPNGGPTLTALSMGDPEIFGGGVICALATVTVLAPVVPTETSTPATPTETSTPATPTETSTPVTPTSTPATPTATATETTVPATPSQEATPGTSATGAPTSAPASVVTGLPETGNGASRSGMASMMAVTIAAATIMIVAIGIRVRSSHD